MNKKSQEGGMWWIIVAGAVAAIGLILYIFIIGGGISKFRQGMEECESKGGVCLSPEQLNAGACPDNAPVKAFSGCYIKSTDEKGAKKDEYKADYACCLKS